MSEAYPRFLSGGVAATGPASWLSRARVLVADNRLRFLALVIAPTALASIYFGLIAAPQFVSHTEYIVRGVDAQHATGLSTLLNTFGISRAADETSAIESFLKSREVLAKLDGRVDIRAAYGARSADALARFPRFWEKGSFEDLFAYTRSLIAIVKDPASGVTRLDVAAFDPASAERIAGAMLTLAGEMANSLNAKAQADTVEAARGEVQAARDEVVKVQSDLTAFRNEALMVDPLAFAGAMLQDIGALALEKARTQAQIAEAERLSPNAPALNGLRASADALGHGVDAERAKLAGGGQALAGKVENYERLSLLRDLAEKRYAAALGSLQAAEAEAQRKRVYIEEVVRPNLPDEPTEPERLRSVLSVFVVGAIAFSILWILSVGSKDHAQ